MVKKDRDFSKRKFKNYSFYRLKVALDISSPKIHDKGFFCSCILFFCRNSKNFASALYYLDSNLYVFSGRGIPYTPSFKLFETVQKQSVLSLSKFLLLLLFSLQDFGTKHV